MLQIFKKIACLMGALAVVHQAGAFTIWGPAEAYQTPALDYQVRAFYGTTELGGPKNFGQGSRLNVPIITYAYDYTFLNYFGAQGVKAIDGAMAVLNALPNADAMNLSKFNTEGVEEVNYTAQAMSLVDLKSAMLGIMVEHMGLLGETHVYDLRGRVPLPGGSCLFDYFVINRNYDPVTYNPSDYVNGTLYSYIIGELCPLPNVGDALETLVDATKPPSVYTAVATKEAILNGGLFYTALSRDDAGGLRYLYRRNNFNNETLDGESVPGSVTSGFQIVNPFATNSFSSNTAGIYGGVGKIRFVKVFFDSFIGTNFTPFVTHYSIPVITNGQLKSLPITRTVLRPDIIISAADLAAPPATPLYSRSVTFLTNGVSSLGGGIANSVIAPQMDVVFGTVGAIYLNTQQFFLDQATAVEYPIFIWGSFDGTGNAPIIYPNGSSVEALEAQVMSGTSFVAPGTWNPFGINTNGSTVTPVSQ